MHTTDVERLEELCEEIWSLAEIGQNLYERVVRGSKIQNAAAVVQELRRLGLATVEHEEAGRVDLTPAGREMASAIVRRHRLAEMLLSQVLALDEETSETTACRMEHILSPEVTDSVCSFLGHPPLCPHGKPIPGGRCCELFTLEVKPIVVRMVDLRVGDAGKVVFIRSSSDRRFDRVGALGLVPGALLRLKQKRPTVVIEVGQTTVALDHGIAGEIYVQRVRPAAGS